VSLHPAAAPLRACSLVFLAALAACAERQALPNDPTGRLFARGLDEITDLYIAPVSSRRLVLGGAGRLSRRLRGQTRQTLCWLMPGMRWPPIRYPRMTTRMIGAA
jgi:hypothetical protein